MQSAKFQIGDATRSDSIFARQSIANSRRSQQAPTPDLRNKENDKPLSGGEQQELAKLGGAGGKAPVSNVGMKKGMTKFYLSDEDKKQYLNYEPIRPNLIAWEELKELETFAVKSYKDSVYRGELKDSKRDGKGVITYNSSRVYEGEWQADKRHGIGYERFSNGNVYEGEYF